MLASKVHHGAVLGELTARPNPLWLRTSAGGGSVAVNSFKRAPWWTVAWRQVELLPVGDGIGIWYLRGKPSNNTKRYKLKALRNQNEHYFLTSY